MDEIPTGVPYAWALLVIALLFLGGAVLSGVRFVSSGGKPSHVLGLVFNGILAMIMGWVAWLALTGSPTL